MPNLQELLAQKAEIERQIAETRQQERAEAISKVRELMNAHGLTAADLSGRGTAAPKAGGAKAAAGGARKVAVKYRNAATGETWTGRGLQPKWLKSALATGKTLADFEV